MTVQDHRRFDKRDALAVALLGVAIGTIVLGVGGRISMRAIAHVQGQTPGFSLGGSATVVFLGAVWGLGGALWFAVLRRALRGHRMVRGAVFWTGIVAATLLALSPLNPARVALFMPLAIVYGVALQVIWCRWSTRRLAVP
jgi:hypothetical protein